MWGRAGGGDGGYEAKPPKCFGPEVHRRSREQCTQGRFFAHVELCFAIEGSVTTKTRVRSGIGVLVLTSATCEPRSFSSKTGTQTLPTEPVILSLYRQEARVG